MNDSLGDRIKNNYERRAKHYLTRRTPVVIRVDGRAFHTLTKAFHKPFDSRFIEAMILASTHVFSEVQGCKIAYIQSDEASFVLTDYDDLQTQAWFDYCQNKIESITAALMSVAFGRYLRLMGNTDLAVFDARAFNIPENEVANYLLWRAKDWHRNSIQMLAQANFPHGCLQGLSASQALTKLDAAGHPWDRLDNVEKNGTFLVANNLIGIHEQTDVRDHYEEIAQLWDRVNPTTNTAPSIDRIPSIVTSATESKPGAVGSKNGTPEIGTIPRGLVTRRSLT